MRRRALFGAAGAALAGPALAQGAWPNRPIRMIVPFPPGGGTDFVSRIAAQRLSEALGQPVVVENRPGAGGTIGANAVAQAAPDGYTIGMATSSTHPAALVLQRSVPYDPVAGFTPITQVGVTPYVLVGGSAMPGRTLAEFIAAVRSEPGRLSYASVGTSTLGYLLTRQFEALTGTQMTHVPYRGSAQVYPDLLNGTVAFILDNPSGSAGLIREGRLRALAITRRAAALPEVPSFADAGVPGFEGVFWYGLVAPAGMPAEIANRMQQELARQLQVAQHRQELVSRDVEPTVTSPAEFGAIIASDVTWMRETATRLGIQPE